MWWPSSKLHDRPRTADKLTGREAAPRRDVVYRGSTFPELDLDAVLARNPEVALVDELAHTNVPGLQHAKRWQDVETLLEAGINVISTVNVQHLESPNDVVQAITGVPQRETVPDSVVRAAEQVELVDMTPEAIRRRMAHGNIYKPDKIDAALANYFRPGNLTALRELALLWLADSVDEGLQRYREQHGIAATWETRERVVVALTGGPEGDTLIRRAARIAARATGGELFGVHIARSDGLAGSSIAALDQQRLLLESLGGSYHSVIGDDVSTAVLDFARANNATQIVIGASRRRPIVAALTGPGTGMTITRRSGSIDVHVVSHDYIGKGRVLPRLTGGLTTRRRIAGLLLGALMLAILVLLCSRWRADLSLVATSRCSCWQWHREPGRRILARARRGRRRQPAAELLLRPPIHTFTISKRQLPRPCRVHPHRGARVPCCRPSRATHRRGGPLKRRGRNPSTWPVACSAASRHFPRCWTGCGKPSPCTASRCYGRSATHQPAAALSMPAPRAGCGAPGPA